MICLRCLKTVRYPAPRLVPYCSRTCRGALSRKRKARVDTPPRCAQCDEVYTNKRSRPFCGWQCKRSFWATRSETGQLERQRGKLAILCARARLRCRKAQRRAEAKEIGDTHYTTPTGFRSRLPSWGVIEKEVAESSQDLAATLAALAAWDASPDGQHLAETMVLTPR